MCVALVFWHEKCMHCVRLSSVARLALACFSTVSQTQHDVQGKLLNIKHVL
jgi:hypothetical protein